MLYFWRCMPVCRTGTFFVLQANFVKIKLKACSFSASVRHACGHLCISKEALVAVSTPAASRNDMAWQRYALCGVPSSC